MSLFIAMGRILDYKNTRELDSDTKQQCICGCEDCYGEGVWKIIVKKEYRGVFGKKCGPYCGECLIEEIGGYHTGGGLHEDAIKKIVRKRKFK